MAQTCSLCHVYFILFSFYNYEVHSFYAFTSQTGNYDEQQKSS